jgi:hypothetical protein
MRVPTFRSALPALLIILMMIAGILASMPLATWFWWAAPPLEIYYSGAYFSSTITRGNPAATTEVQWLYKAAPGQADQLAEEQDVVADNPENQRNISIPMHLSSAAENAGWSYLIRGPREQISAAKLEPFLREEFYGGRSFWRLFLQPILWGIALVFTTLGAREWFAGRTRNRRAERLVTSPDLIWDSYRDPMMERLGMPQRIGLRFQIVYWFENLQIKGDELLVRAVRNLKRRRTSIDDEITFPTPTLKARVASCLIVSDQQTDVGVKMKPALQLSASAPDVDRSHKSEADNSTTRTRKNPVKRHLIFPGATGEQRADQRSRTWDVSQWID